MKRLIKICGFLSLCLLLVACPKDDAPEIIPARPHADVYPEDLAKIEEYLKTHYLDINDENADGDFHVSEILIKKIDAAQVSIWDQTDYPLLHKMVKVYGVDFKVYYLKLDGKTDTEADGEKPGGFDNIFFAYRGSLLNDTQIDYAPNGVSFGLLDLVKGWEYMMPEFRAGYFDAPNGDGTLNPRNYGSGIMFLPSGLGYYSNGSINVPSYSPLVFTFNLYAVTHLDQDEDEIEDRYEYAFNADGTLVDTDGDGFPNVFDGDDDDDGFITKDEIKYIHPSDPNDVVRYYPFTGASVDDAATLYVDETQGIPRCFTGTVVGGLPTSVPADFTEPSRVRRHLDANCRPPFGE